MPKEISKWLPQTSSLISEVEGGGGGGGAVITQRSLRDRLVEKQKRLIERERMVIKILENIWQRNCITLKKHMNKKKRLFESKRLSR